MKKILIPIIISVISGIIIWILTTFGEKKVNPFVFEPESASKLCISSIDESVGGWMKSNKNYSIKITIYNEGNAIGKQIRKCIFVYKSLDSLRSDACSMEDLDNLELQGKVEKILKLTDCSEYFSLLPKKSKEIVLNLKIKEKGVYWLLIPMGGTDFSLFGDFYNSIYKDWVVATQVD